MEYIGTTINDSATIVLKANAILEGAQGIGIGVTSGKAALPSAGANAIGLALFSNDSKVPANGDVQIQIKGIGKMIAAEAIAVGDEIAVDATGKAKKAVAKQFILGVALTEAKAAGSVFEIQITKSGYKPAE